MKLFLLTFTFSLLYSSTCRIENSNLRSYYEIGDTLTFEDQNLLFPVCNGSGDYSTGDSFKLSDLNGNENDGDYKITLISMNATW
ncbi:MAG: hypothetical protein CMG49_04910 [Candidatus Marinimicrobia bacterium]|nr:hypothetical protein [Candidatus Neomarinimicrobiota bacterium]